MADIVNSTSGRTINGTDGNDFIVSNDDAAYVTILSKEGNDTINNKSQFTLVNSGDGNDLINNSADEATLCGGSGNGNNTINNTANNVDILNTQNKEYTFNSGSQVTIHANSVINNRGDHAQIIAHQWGTVTLTNQADANFSTIKGGAYDDSIVNYAYGVSIDGERGNDFIDNYGAKDVTVIGGNGYDTIVNHVRASGITVDGGKGNDIISLAGGDEVLIFNDGDGNDTVYGATNQTKFAFEYDSSSVNSYYDRNIAANVSDVIVKVGDGSITFKNTNMIRFYDTITGTDQDDTIDNIDGMKFISTGDGNDYINSWSASNLIINTGDGNDTLYGLSGRFITINGGNGNDFFYTLANYALLSGDQGSDTLNASTHSTLLGGDGDDSITGSSYSSLDGGDGNDYLKGFGNSTFIGGKGDDVIDLYQNETNVRIIYNNGDGNDTITCYSDKTTLDVDYDTVEQQGDDVLVKVGDGSILIKNTTVDYFLTGKTGTDGDDTINNTVQKNIDAGAGNDYIVNNYGYLQIDAGDGDDTIVNNYGVKVTMLGGNGDDSIVSNYSGAIIDAGEGDDTVHNNASNAIVNAGSGNDFIDNHASLSTLLAGDGDDTIVDYTRKNVIINSGKGNDVISLVGGSGGGAVTFDKDGGNDTVYGFNINNYAIGNQYDSLTEVGDNVLMSVGDSTITFVNNKIYDLVKGQKFQVNKNYVYVEGDNGNDEIRSVGGTGRGSTINALGGNDIINNNNNFMSINGGDGDDVINNYGDIIGGGAYVTINGGKGNDVISLLNGRNEVVIEYNEGDGNDVVHGFGSRTTLKAYYDSATQSGNDVIVKIGDGSITFKDTSIGLFNVNGNHQLPAYDEYDALEELVEPTVDNINDELTDILQPAAITDLGALETSSNDFFKAVGNTIETKFADVVRKHRKS